MRATVAWSRLARWPEAAYARPGGPPKRDGAWDQTVWEDRTHWTVSLLGNILVALFFAIFLYVAIKFWIRTGSPLAIGVVTFNSIAVACLLTRRRSTRVTGSIRNWILAPLAAIMPLLLRPVGSASWPAILVSGVGQAIGLAIMIASLMVLNRSIGIVAANRGVKTRGPYAWVRHPLYAGEIFFYVSFLISEWSYPNALILLASLLAQVIRCFQEEALLLPDARYAAYRMAVPYRLIPGIF